MANIPQKTMHPKPPNLEVKDLVRWATGSMNQLFQLLVTVIRTLNATVRSNVAANRPTVPALNEITYYSNDSGQGWVAINGAWKNIAPRRGRETLASGLSSIAVSFAYVGSTASYVPTVTASYDAGHVWVTSIVDAGFTINVTSTDADTQEMYWTIFDEWD